MAPRFVQSSLPWVSLSPGWNLHGPGGLGLLETAALFLEGNHSPPWFRLVFSKIKFASCSLQPRACPSVSAQLKRFRGSWRGSGTKEK